MKAPYRNKLLVCGLPVVSVSGIESSGSTNRNWIISYSITVGHKLRNSNLNEGQLNLKLN
jgi:hypothetical protein